MIQKLRRQSVRASSIKDKFGLGSKSSTFRSKSFVVPITMPEDRDRFVFLLQILICNNSIIRSFVFTVYDKNMYITMHKPNNKKVYPILMNVCLLVTKSLKIKYGIYE